MISDSILRIIVGANFFLATAGADLALARRRILRFFLALLILEQTRAQNTECFFLVLLLAASVLATHDPARRNVHHLYGRVGRVHALATGSAGATNFNTQIFGLQLEI